MRRTFAADEATIVPDDTEIEQEAASSPELTDAVADKPDPYFDPTDEELADTPEPASESEPAADATKDAADSPDPAVDEALVKRAMELGLTKDEAESLGSSESLKRVLEVYEKTAGADKTTEESAPAKFEMPELDPDVFEPQIIEAFGKLNDHYHNLFTQQQAAIAKMREQMAGVAGAMGKELQTAEQRRVSGYFDGLGKEWKDVFGGKDSTANRTKVTDEMKVIEAGLKALGKPAMNETELFTRALNSAFGEQLKEITKQKLSSSARDKSGQFLARPTHRNGSVLSNRAKAIASVSALLGQGRQIGLDDELEDSFG